MSEDCTLETGSDGVTRISGALTFETCPSLYRSMQQQRLGGATVTQIDLSRVPNADSAGLALLLEWQAESRAAGHDLPMVAAPDGLMQLARLCEADEVLQMSGREPSP